MRRERETESNVISFLNSATNLIDAVSKLISTAVALCAGAVGTTISGGTNVACNKWLIGIIVAIVFWVIIFCILSRVLTKDRKETIARNRLYKILNKTAMPKSYKLTEKEAIYEFKERTKMRHEKIFKYEVLHQDFSGIDDKYGWTGGAPLAVEAKDPRRYEIETFGHKFGLNRYKIKLKDGHRHNIGETGTMVTVFENINDPNKKACLHLSAGIFEETDRLILKVLFPTTLVPVNAVGEEYIHYNDENHYGHPKELELKILDGKLCLEYVIEKPFYGGRYMIKWDFRDEIA